MDTKLSAYEIVKNYIIDQVHKKNFTIGSKLPTEDQLSEELRCSKSSIRDALKLLSSRGIILTKQGSGNYLQMDITKDVSESINLMLALNQYTNAEISQLREAIDLKAFELSCYKVNPQRKQGLQELKTEVYKIKNNEELKYSDISFHKKIIEMSGNPLLLMITNALINNSKDYILISWDSVDESKKEELKSIHEEIFESLVECDIERGCRAIKKHYWLATTLFSDHKEYLMQTIQQTNISAEQLNDILKILENYN